MVSSQLIDSVRRGISLLVRDSAGCSALHLAAQNGHTDLVSFILQQGEKLESIPRHWMNNVDNFYANVGTSRNSNASISSGHSIWLQLVYWRKTKLRLPEILSAAS